MQNPQASSSISGNEIEKTDEGYGGSDSENEECPQLKKALTLSLGEKPCGSLLTFTSSTASPSAASRSDRLVELAQVTAESWVPFMFLPSLPDRDRTSDLLRGNKTVSAFVLPFNFF